MKTKSTFPEGCGCQLKSFCDALILKWLYYKELKAKYDISYRAGKISSTGSDFRYLHVWYLHVCEAGSCTVLSPSALVPAL